MATSVGITLVHTEICQQILDGLPGNLVQTFMVAMSTFAVVLLQVVTFLVAPPEAQRLHLKYIIYYKYNLVQTFMVPT